jgi:signal transduction histidine kinase
MQQPAAAPLGADIAKDIAEIGAIAAVPRILETVAHITGSRFAAVARVTDSHWVACATYDTLGFGLGVGGQLVLETTICNEIRQAPQPVIFGHASEHPHYASHHTPRLYGLESYVSVPIFRPDGSFFGTLCAIDSAPATFDEAQVVRSLELFAELIGNYLHTEQRLQQAVADLSAANDTAVLRDQFIAVLGHDLRSPLQAASMATEMLELEPHTERGGMLLTRVRDSITRIDGLVKDVLDFARGRLGGGIPVALTYDANVAAQLMQVVHEVAGATGRSDIIASIAVDAPLLCDANRLSQLLANLLTNAAVHGAPDQPITLDIETDANGLLLQVHNGGAIAPDKLAKLFTPFSREAGDQPRPGLGLGLYIAAEIAKAHNGTLSVESDAAQGTRFVFAMPAMPLALAG